MIREYLTLLLFAHIIGDFYIQPQSQAKKRAQSFKWVLLHCLYYGIPVFLLTIPVFSGVALLFGSIAILSHMIIDTLKFSYTRNLNAKTTSIKTERNIFFIDQTLHFACIFVIAYLFSAFGNTLTLQPWVQDFLTTSGIPALPLLRWICILAVAAKPLNLAISLLLSPYRPNDKNDIQNKATDKNAGRFIGILERIIILIFISLGQYAAIGLVLTAKSIARYDKISKDPTFAEYYLMGTLLSTLAAISISFIL